MNATSLICVNMCLYLCKHVLPFLKNHKHVFWDTRNILQDIFKHQISIFQENQCL